MNSTVSPSWTSRPIALGVTSKKEGTWEAWQSTRDRLNEDICEQIAAYANLPDDWDSYGATAPDQDVIECARGAAYALAGFGIRVLDASAGAGNNIGLTFRHKGVDFLIDLDEEEWQVRIQRPGKAAEYHKFTPSEAKNVHAILRLA